MLESLSRDDLHCILDDSTLVGKTMTDIRSVWNGLTAEDYNSLSNSFFQHMRIEKRHGFFKLFRGCLVADQTSHTSNGTTSPNRTTTNDVHNRRLYTTIPSLEPLLIGLPVSNNTEATSTVVLQKTIQHPLHPDDEESHHDEMASTSTGCAVSTTSSIAGSVASTAGSVASV
jgi:hypothetical protein